MYTCSCLYNEAVYNEAVVNLTTEKNLKPFKLLKTDHNILYTCVCLLQVSYEVFLTL